MEFFYAYVPVREEGIISKVKYLHASSRLMLPNMGTINYMCRGERPEI